MTEVSFSFSFRRVLAVIGKGKLYSIKKESHDEEKIIKIIDIGFGKDKRYGFEIEFKKIPITIRIYYDEDYSKLDNDRDRIFYIKEKYQHFFKLALSGMMYDHFKMWLTRIHDKGVEEGKNEIKKRFEDLFS